MNPRLALGIALACGGFAIALVAVDLQFTLSAHLETERDGEWQPVTEERAPRPFGEPSGGCVTPHLRLVVDNGRLLAATVPVWITYYHLGSQREVTVLDEEWHLARGEVRMHEFTIPADAFEAPAQQEGLPLNTVWVNVFVDGEYVPGACVEAPT